MLTFEAIEEFEAGPRWAALFERHWPRYKAWFLHEGEAARTSYAASLRALREHMPELVPTYEKICALAGGGDLEARFLGMWAPPSYLAGCSQAVWQVGDPILARNYDYAPERLEGSILHTRWVRPVIGSGD
jgi:predicted choloylglycine hydrolase